MIDFNKKTMDINTLTNKLKTEDERNARMSKKIQNIYWVLIPIYVLMMLVYLFHNEPFSKVLGSICMLLGMLVFVTLFRRYVKMYKNVDYTLPTLIMLKSAAKRYRPFRSDFIWVMLALLFIDAGLAFLQVGYWDPVIIQIVFLGIVVIGIFIGLIWWFIKYKPILSAVLSLIREIERDF